jgi:Beta-ketoacyl synthase, N-terminal domain
MSHTIYIQSIGLFGTGFENWASAEKILSGEQPYLATAAVPPSPEWLPPAERRRTSDIIRLAMVAGKEALANAQSSPSDSATVFSSSGGSGEVIHQICESLASDERDVSPTRFHNSVHNAPAGYWGIAAKNEWPSTSLCGHDESFAVGLIEAIAQAKSQSHSVLLLVHDLPYPEPLNSVRPVHGLFSLALLLTAKPDEKSRYALTLHMSVDQQDQDLETTLTDESLEHFRLGNPAARALPLLVAIAKKSKAPFTIAGTNQTLLTMSVHDVNATSNA